MSLDEEGTRNAIGRSRLRWVGLGLLAAIVVCGDRIHLAVLETNGQISYIKADREG